MTDDEKCDEPVCEASEGLNVFCDTVSNSKSCKVVMEKMLLGDIDAQEAKQELIDEIGEEEYMKGAQALKVWTEDKRTEHEIKKIESSFRDSKIDIDAEIEKIRKKYGLDKKLS